MAVIVVVEDDVDVREVTVMVLRRAGHTVTVAGDGVAGLEAVRDKRPDVVVSDIEMPLMSGVEMCRAIRAEPATSDLPVLLVSGSVAVGDTRPADAGATAFLRKPFQGRELLECVQKVLHAGHQPGQPPTECP